MSKGFLWFAQNNSATDYVKLSIRLAESIKWWEPQSQICVVTDNNSKFEHKSIDYVKVLDTDESEKHDIKWANEFKAFQLSPFTHTIKLESDMLWNDHTNWWWYHLWQHDLVFSVDCKNYKDQTIKDKAYRRLFVNNNLPNIYNGLMYFRKSRWAQRFFRMAESLVRNWNDVKKTMLINCHDEYPSTDLVYALAYRIIDPTCEKLIDYPWFKFIHHKPAINGLAHIRDHNNYLYPNREGQKIYLGPHRVSRVWHYHDKELNVRTT